MNIKGNIGQLALAALVAASLQGCIKDDLKDCPRREVLLTYSMNMEFADAAEHNIAEAELRAYDADGQLVYTKTVDAEELRRDAFRIDVDDMPSGKYTLVVWAKGEEKRADSYTTGDAATFEGWTQRINRQTKTRNEQYSAVEGDLTPLFHGIYTNFDTTPGAPELTVVDLTKDTNVVRIVLQNLSGEELEPDFFTFEITDNNGYMASDNSLKDDAVLTYLPWSVYSGKAGETVNAVVAEFTTGRFVEGHDMRLNIYNDEGTTVLSVPVIDYGLLVKGNYLQSMSNQEYLDRQSVWNMTFFLDKNINWISTSILINSWRVVLQDTNI